MAPKDEWQRLWQLLESHLDVPTSTLTEMLFDFIRGYAYGDEEVHNFQRIFIPSLRTGPLHYRVEAVRQGCFQVKTSTTLWKLLGTSGPKYKVESSTVSFSTTEKLSLVHSSAIALGIRFPDEVVVRRRGQFQWHIYGEWWGEFVTRVASAASIEDLHTVETVRPWDVHQVPIWRGTPLVSVIGGALCYLSPDIRFSRWDTVFQRTLKQWLEEIQNGGVDLLTYGQREQSLLNEVKGAFDADAIERNRHQVRDSMALAAYSKSAYGQEMYRNERYWIPIRIVSIKIGDQPDDWGIVWAPEFESMARQFWELVEREQRVMPGSWVDG